MPHEPTVCAILLTRDRPELAKRAIECFRKQTYEPHLRRLYVLDNGIAPSTDALPDGYPKDRIMYHRALPTTDTGTVPTIGSLRNYAIAWADNDRSWHSIHHPDILIHWDDDDWSHPNRIAEQVALLQASGADCVGYNELLFWRTTGHLIEEDFLTDDKRVTETGEAWLYTATRGGVPALGTSLCYWRKTWERHHFANETQGVEDHWLREKNVVAPSSLGEPFYHVDQETNKPTQPMIFKNRGDEPRMIARIHGGNTSNGYKLEEYVSKGSKEWQRVTQWDQRIRELLG